MQHLTRGRPALNAVFPQFSPLMIQRAYRTAPSTSFGSMLRVAAIALCVALAGCERPNAEASPDTFTVRDSAGIEIVENRGPAWAPGEEWRVSATPELDIGVVEGDSMYQLFRVWGATRMADGRVAVAVSGTSQIRIFAPDGTFLRAVGREGEGPGEFRQLMGIWNVGGDSLVAWDGGLRRITLLDPDASVVRQVVLSGNPSNPWLLRPLEDGRYALVDDRYSFGQSGMEDQFMEVTLHTPTGAFEDSVGRFVVARMGRIGTDEMTRVGSALFAPRTNVVTIGGKLAVGPGGAPEFAEYDAQGELVRIVRWPDADRKVQDADVERYHEQQLASIEDENQRRAERAYLATVPVEQQFPVYDLMLAGADGGVWLREFRRPREEGPQRWMIFDPAGQLLGSVAMPNGLWLHEVGTDYILGVERDEFDVEHVRLYRLERG